MTGIAAISGGRCVLLKEGERLQSKVSVVLLKLWHVRFAWSNESLQRVIPGYVSNIEIKHTSTCTKNM